MPTANQMIQFDVFENPVRRARKAYPFIVILQSDRAETGRDRIVAPLVPRSDFDTLAGRLTPVTIVAGQGYVILMPAMTTIMAADFGASLQNIETSAREAIVAAVDYLFLGI